MGTICSKIDNSVTRDNCVKKCSDSSSPGISVINTKCEISCNPFVKCLQGWANKDCDDMEKLADSYVKKLHGDNDKIKNFIDQWNSSIKILTTKPDILRLVGEIVGKFRANLTCFSDRVSEKLGISEKLDIPDDLDLGMAEGAKAVPKFFVYILIVISMFILSIFTFLPAIKQNPLLNIIPIALISIIVIIIIHFFNNY